MVKQGYYVYRFLNKDNVVIYVGRTVNLNRRFINHDHLHDEIEKIQYIECNTEADMVWKEVYYINYFKNELTTNVSDLYDGVTDIGLNDEWKDYKYSDIYGEIDYMNTYNKYKYLLSNPPKYGYKNLIKVLDHEKLNNIADYRSKNSAFSQAWYRKHKDDGTMKKIMKHINNYFRNVAPKNIEFSKKQMLWTVFPNIKHDIEIKGIIKSFINIGEEIDENESKVVLAFMGNIYFPGKKDGQIFDFSEDDFALTILLSFIFQSDLRNGKEILIYIPSIRMRTLLKQWIDGNS